MADMVDTSQESVIENYDLFEIDPTEEGKPKKTKKDKPAGKNGSNKFKLAAAETSEAPEFPAIEPEFSENAITVLRKRYLLKNEEGQVIETPRGMLERVARFIAKGDVNYPDNNCASTEKTFYEMMARLEFLPNSPTLMNAGRSLGQLSACFVLPLEDSMDSIFETVKNTALIHKSGGGTGFSFSRIRPKSDIVRSTKGVSSGPISFMGVFDAATETIKQGGTRRGANMAILRVDHPDIIDFITSKKEHDRLNNFNISVALTEDFMTALRENDSYPLINPRTKQIAKHLKARDVFDQITQLAWQNGDPGVVFIDKINADNPTPHVGEIESTNPCGEQPLLPYESCNLGSINLVKFFKDGEIDYEHLREVVQTAVHFLDNVIDQNKYPIEPIAKMTRANRKIGLGVMGFADLLFKMNIPYNSDIACHLAEKLMDFINTEAQKKSMDLAKTRGAFPNYKGSTWDKPGANPVRNATVTTIAPTGTISIIASCSSGVEPLFALCFVRNVMDDNKLMEIHPYFEQIARKHDFYSEGLMAKIADNGTVHGLNEVPDEFQKIFVSAHDITPEAHVKMQAAFQKFTDNAVSKTVNFPNTASVDDIRKAYMMAYEQNCKGITIYRDGSRDVQVLTRGSKSTNKEETATEPVEVFRDVKKSRPKVLIGKSYKMETGCGTLYVNINADKSKPFELFNHMGKAGGCAASQSEAIGRLVSLAFRGGIDPREITQQLRGISCYRPHGFGPNKILSCADAIGRAVNLFLDMNEASRPELAGGACPECGGPMEPEGGCAVCHACGFSECA